jgi:hypothetical protein
LDLQIYADDLAYVKPLVTQKDEDGFKQDMEILTQKYKDIALALNAKKSK